MWYAGGWTDAVPNVHLGVYGYSAADSCGPDMAFARGLIHSGTARQVRQRTTYIQKAEWGM